MGRPSPSNQVGFDDVIRKLFADGMSMRAMARTLRVSTATVHRRLKALGLSRSAADGAAMMHVTTATERLEEKMAAVPVCDDVECDQPAVGRYQGRALCKPHMTWAVEGPHGPARPWRSAGVVLFDDGDDDEMTDDVPTLHAAIRALRHNLDVLFDQLVRKR